MAAGRYVVFAPFNADNVGVLDTQTDTFSTVPTTGAIPANSTYKYRGAAALGTRAYFAPHDEDNVGVFDVSDSSFFVVSTTAAGEYSNRK